MSEFDLTHDPFDIDGIPPGWMARSLAACGCGIQSGFASGIHNREGVGIPHLRPMNISAQGDVNLSDLRYIADEGGVRLLTGDVLFNNTNSPAWVGKTAIVRHEAVLAFSNHMTRIRCSGVLDPSFVATQLHALQQMGYFRSRCKKHVNQASIAGPALTQTTPLLVPPLPEQRRIVTKLDELRDRSRKAREALDEVPALLDKLKQSILASAFRGDLTADWRAAHPDVEPASVLLDRIRAERRARWERANPKKRYVAPEPADTNGLPELPEGWCWAPFAELGLDPDGTIQTGPFGAQLHSDEFVEKGIPVIAVGNLTGGGFTTANIYYISEEKAVQLSRYDVQAGDVLFARSGATLGKVCVAPSFVRDWRMTGHILRARTSPDVNPNLVVWALSAFPAVVDQVQGRVRGMTRPGYNTTLLGEILLPIPPFSEQEQVVLRVSGLFEGLSSELEHLRSMNADLMQLDRAVLAKAFRGELVAQDPTDEPAAALLARLHAATRGAGPATRRGRKPKAAS